MDAHDVPPLEYRPDRDYPEAPPAAPVASAPPILWPHAVVEQEPTAGQVLS